MSESTSVYSPQLWLQSRPLSVGIIVASLTILVSELLPPSFAANLHAMILVFITAPNAGFASIDGGTREMLTERASITLFCGLAVAGLWVWEPLWIIGHAGHALWDTLHHPGSGFGAQIVGWYIPFCVVYDRVVAGYLTVVIASI